MIEDPSQLDLDQDQNLYLTNLKKIKNHELRDRNYAGNTPFWSATEVCLESGSSLQ
jgi:hypothetical protein